jgi:hypothetical protein
VLRTEPPELLLSTARKRTQPLPTDPWISRFGCKAACPLRPLESQDAKAGSSIWSLKKHFGRAPCGATVRPKFKLWVLSYAALRRCAFRAAGRRGLTAGSRRALPERLAASTLALALRTGLVFFFFAIFAIVVSLPSQIYHCPNESRHLRQKECYSRR